jgi:hypothetical protein
MSLIFEPTAHVLLQGSSLHLGISAQGSLRISVQVSTVRVASQVKVLREMRQGRV